MKTVKPAGTVSFFLVWASIASFLIYQTYQEIKIVNQQIFPKTDSINNNE